MGEKTRGQEVATILKEGPPLAWYVGLGTIEKGISIVTWNSTLGQMGEGKVRELISDWWHYRGNPTKRHHGQKRKDADESRTMEAETTINRITGYTPLQIREKASQLEDIYKGQKEAPFEVELD